MSGNKHEGKTPVVSTIIAALCVILYIGALSYGALSIYNSIIERRALADREFDRLTDLVTATGVLGFMDEPFIKIVQDSIDVSQTILGVVISSSRGEFAFEREPGTVINWVDDSPRFIPRFAVTNPPKYLPLRIEGQRNVNIQAVCGFLDYDYCIGVLKKTLMIVLFSLVLAFFTLLMDTLLAKSRNTAGRAPREPQPSADSGEEASPVKASPVKAPPAKAPPAPAVDVNTEEPAEHRIPDDWTPPDDDDEPDFDLGDDDEAPQFAFNGNDDSDDDEQSDENPQGLFSPSSGVGWEAYTEERLESELRRCASTEQDLVLIFMTIMEPEQLGAEQFQLFCQEAARHFEHRDLIFEYGKQGISVICPGLSLEQAFGTSEEFNNRVLGKLVQPDGSIIELRFGISSRSGRLINAAQIALEAGEALKRAIVDPASAIVAFKSDPEKYRQHVATRR